MRPLNVKSGVPIGLRQYHGLYRLLTASAKAHLREEVTDDDFDIVENIIKESYKSMKMDLEKGEVKDTMINSKDTKKTIILETWGECCDPEFENTVDKHEFIEKLSTKEGFNALTSPLAFKQLEDSGVLNYDNDLERYKKIG